jgi:hypothetical protein
MSKPLPPKLEDDLGNVGRFKASTPKRDENMSSGNRPFPRRRSMPSSNALQKVFDDQVKRSMYDEIFGHILPQQRTSQQTTKFASGSAVDALRQATTSEDASSDFTTNLLSRLRLVEKEAKENREKLATEAIKNELLSEEIARLRRFSEEPHYALNQLRVAKRENEDLKQQLLEMEEFLADYGLVWVGKQGQRHGQGQIVEEDHMDEEENASDAGHLAPFSAFAKAVQELNAVIYSEPTQVVVEQETKKGRLVQAAERVQRIKLAYYKNGIMIKNGPFRRSDSDSYRTFVSDILDGYFPSEFRDMYPDGVLFDLVDKHNDIYYDQIHTISTSSSDPSTSAQQFLNRLPKTVVQNGNIVNIRGEIADRLQGCANKPSGTGQERSRSSPTNSLSAAATTGLPNGIVTTKNGMIIMQTFAVRTGVLDLLGEVAEVATSHSVSDPGDVKDIVKVNVRWTDDKKSVLQAAMFAYDTILHLRQELALHFGVAVDEEMASRVLELRTAYPAKVLSDDVTLREAGLVPNGTVHARRLQGKNDGIVASSESAPH